MGSNFYLKKGDNSAHVKTFFQTKKQCNPSTRKWCNPGVFSHQCCEISNCHISEDIVFQDTDGHQRDQQRDQQTQQRNKIQQ